MQHDDSKRKKENLCAQTHLQAQKAGRVDVESKAAPHNVVAVLLNNGPHLFHNIVCLDLNAAKKKIKICESECASGASSIIFQFIIHCTFLQCLNVQRTPFHAFVKIIHIFLVHSGVFELFVPQWAPRGRQQFASGG